MRFSKRRKSLSNKNSLKDLLKRPFYLKSKHSSNAGGLDGGEIA